MTQVSKTQFDQLIERIHYPADRQDIIDFIREHGKGDGVVASATSLENKIYVNVHDVRDNLVR